jgi:uncharacterized protein (DUF2062 family)
MAFWVRFKDRVRGVLTIKDTPNKLAISFAVGIFLGLSPLIGLHTILALAVAWIFRLNRLTTMSAVYVTNPVSVIPIYTFCTWVGVMILGSDIVLTDVDWRHLTMGDLLHDLSYLLMPFVVGSTVVGLTAAVICYFLIRGAAEKAQRQKLSVEEAEIH